MRPPYFKETDEQWKEFADGYLISSKGRFYSLKAKKVMKQHKNIDGYMRFCVCTFGKHKSYLTHIQVVKFFGDCKGKTLDDIPSLQKQYLSIDHISGDKRDNSIDNLEIVEHQENIRRMYSRTKYLPEAIKKLDEIAEDLGIEGAY